MRTKLFQPDWWAQIDCDRARVRHLDEVGPGILVLPTRHVRPSDPLQCLPPVQRSASILEITQTRNNSKRLKMMMLVKSRQPFHVPMVLGQRFQDADFLNRQTSRIEASRNAHYPRIVFFMRVAPHGGKWTVHQKSCCPGGHQLKDCCIKWMIVE